MDEVGLWSIVIYHPVVHMSWNGCGDCADSGNWVNSFRKALHARCLGCLFRPLVITVALLRDKQLPPKHQEHCKMTILTVGIEVLVENT